MFNLFKAKAPPEPEPQIPDYEFTCKWCVHLRDGVCQRFPAHVRISAPDEHRCGEWEEGVVIANARAKHYQWLIKRARI